MDLCIWDKCNNKCKMCSNPDLPWYSSDGVVEGAYDYDKLKKRLKKQLGKEIDGKPCVESVLFTGGEPTLQPKFLELIDFLEKDYPEIHIGMLTNGRIFSYQNFTSQLMKHDNLYIGMSLYGHDEESHDAVTRAKGSFSQTVKGIRNVLLAKNSSHTIELRTVISGMSYKNLDKTLEFIKESFPDVDRVIMIFIEYEGQLMKYLEDTQITYTELAPYLEKSYGLIKSLPGVRLFHFPLCVVEPKLWPYTWRTLPKTEVDFLPICNDCDYRKYCLGIHKTYLKHIGKDEFSPPQINVKIIEDKDDFKHHPIRAIEK